MINLRGSFPPRRSATPRSASSCDPPVGTRVVVVVIDETTGRADCRPGYRTVTGVELDPGGRPVVTVITDAQWRDWTNDAVTADPARRPIGQKWPADLVWTREGGDPA